MQPKPSADTFRYGVKVKAEAGENYETIKLINWDDPAQNDFAIAEEVTVYGNHERRPDIVLYVNGIAVGLLELKNSRRALAPRSRRQPRGATRRLNRFEALTARAVPRPAAVGADLVDRRAAPRARSARPAVHAEIVLHPPATAVRSGVVA